MKLNQYPMLALAAVTLFVSSCENQETTAIEDKETPSSTGLESVMVSEAPTGPLGVVEARAQAKPGEAITLRGKVGGKMTPISDGVAILVLADEKAIASCDENPDDLCETPWDYCCEDQAKITASIATVQVRGSDGKVVRASLRGKDGLKELSRLVVSGTVDEASNDDVLIVNATQIHVEK